MILYKGYFDSVWIDEGGNLGLSFAFKHRFGSFKDEMIDKIDIYMRENLKNLRQLDIIRNDGELRLDMTFYWKGDDYNLEKQRVMIESYLFGVLIN